MKKILLALFTLMCFSVSASHIVGGEFELIYKGSGLYDLRLIYYFDVLNGFKNVPNPPDPRDEEIYVMIFRKSDNAQMSDRILLPFKSLEHVSYYQPACSNGEIVTDKLIFSQIISLSSSKFNDPDGYYVIWERCCRNYTINNIFSENPDASPSNYAGQTFYLEFPPVVKDGLPFINSTPQLFPPLNDFACPNKLYYADFAGTDLDGDSLVYSLVDPLSTHEAVPVPTLQPAPYPTVNWRPGFDSQHVLKGDPDLRISREGVLTAVPKQIGLFVFAVKCEEFRNGEKIGEVRRDFQMLVVDRCSGGANPVISGKKLEENTYHSGNLQVHFPYIPGDENPDRCVEVKVTDDDIFTDGSEKVKIRARAIGFGKNVSDILPAVRTELLDQSNPEATFSICFEECPYLNAPFKIAIIAEDDACALPLLDTLLLTVTIDPPPNHKPQFIEPAANVVQVVDEADPDILRWDIIGQDVDGDNLTLTSIKDFEFADAGMFKQDLEIVPGSYKGYLQWDADCQRYDYTQRNNFITRFLLEDEDKCLISDPDTVMLDLTVKLPVNVKPEIFITGLRSSDDILHLERQIFDSLDFKVHAVDSDDDQVTLYVEGVGFNTTQYDVVFPTKQDPLVSQASANADFSWELLCDNIDINDRDEFMFRFIAKDYQNKCRFKYSDTLLLPVKALPPDNTRPEFSFLNLNPATELEGNHLEVTRGEQIQLNFTSKDFDNAPLDQLKIELIGATGNVDPSGYSFSEVSGYQAIEAPFTWQPDCSIFKDNIFTNDYKFTFRTYDNRCQNVKGDTIEIAVTISDIEADNESFLPPNVVTANGDGCNDFFGLEGFDDVPTTSCGPIVSPHLPNDNCSGEFGSIRIYNRWGKEVFFSTQRTFRWYPVNEAVGVYFYTILYNHPEDSERVTEFKGSVSVRN